MHGTSIARISLMYLSEFLEARNLYSPALVVREVEVEPVELVLGHEVQQTEHVLHGVKVPGHVQHKAAVSEPGGVHDTCFWYLACRQRACIVSAFRSNQNGSTGPLKRDCYFIA